MQADDARLIRRDALVLRLTIGRRAGAGVAERRPEPMPDGERPPGSSAAETFPRKRLAAD